MVLKKLEIYEKTIKRRFLKIGVYIKIGKYAFTVKNRSIKIRKRGGDYLAICISMYI